MPESFTVDVCYDTPCHWTPPPPLAHAIEQHNELQTLEEEENVDIGPAIAGSETTHNHAKRQSDHDFPSPAQGQSRQGPPRPENPHDDLGESIEVVQHNAMGNVDPDVQQIALDRVQATKVFEAVRRPPSFHNNMDTRYILRPEAIESVFYMWRITGDPVWQEKGWQMWEAIEKVSWTELAYSAITNVNMEDSPKADSMERYIR
jgi:hypothetical protein